MGYGKSQYTVSRLRLLPVGVALLLCCNIAIGCREEEKEMVPGKVDPETTPTMTTTDVLTLISDSGIMRYRIITPLWLMYEEASEPKWRFPNGLKLEQFDSKFKVNASIESDSATYFKDRQLWRLDGYVDIKNLQGEKFLTQQLFWDQRRQKIYSDSFIHIERSGRVIEGYGFESNETMTDYHVLRVSGIFPASQFKTDSAARNRAASDTAGSPTVRNMPPPSAPNHAVAPSGRSPRINERTIVRGQPIIVNDSPMPGQQVVKRKK